MRKRLYAMPAIVLGAILLIAGISFVPKPISAQSPTATTPAAQGTCTCTGGGTAPSTDQTTCNNFCATTGNGTGTFTAAPVTPSSTSSPSSATPTTPSASSSSGCNPSDYKAPGGLLAGVTAQCGACGQCSIADIFTVGNTVVELILGLSGSIMLLMMIYGGFLMLTSSGSAGQIDKAKKVLVGAIIGLIIVFAAYTAVEFILGALGVPNVAEVFSRPFQTVKK